MGGADSPKFYLLTIVIVFPFREKRISPRPRQNIQNSIYIIILF